MTGRERTGREGKGEETARGREGKGKGKGEKERRGEEGKGKRPATNVGWL